MGDVVAAMGVGNETLGTLSRPLDRPAHFLGRPGDEGFLGIVKNLRTKAAADIGGDHAQLVLRNGEHERAHQQADDMRVL